MNVIEGLRILYKLNGGDEADLKSLIGNTYQHMHNVLYGDGLYTPLGNNISDNIDRMVETGNELLVPRKDVNFYDYDGTVLYSYKTDDFLALSELPKNPTHEGLTAQGWNWTLEEAQDYVSKYGILEVGQMYVTDDGKTRIYIELPEENFHSYEMQHLFICVNGTVEIDWGEEGAKEIVSSSSLNTLISKFHSYSSPGKYIITIEVLSGSFVFYYSSPFKPKTSIKEVYLGKSVDLNASIFSGCSELTTITIPNTVTNFGGGSIFQYCSSLRGITIPNSVNNIGYSGFNGCCNLEYISFPPNLLAINSQSFLSCYLLKTLTVPEKVTDIGSNNFADCYSLINIVIPEGVTMLTNGVFIGCKNIRNIVIPYSVTTITNAAFEGCSNLRKIIIPDKVTTIDNGAFKGCENLYFVKLSKSLTKLGANTFNGCGKLTSVVVPELVTEIGNKAFYNCMDVTKYTFLPTTPPTLGTDVFCDANQEINRACAFYVPAESVDAYKTADGWKDYANIIRAIGE